MKAWLFPWFARKFRLGIVCVLSLACSAGALAQERGKPAERRPRLVKPRTASVAPIEVKPGTKFARELEAPHEQWLERVLFAPFRARAEGTGNAAAIRFVEEALRDLSKVCCCDWPDKLAAEGNRLLAAGADDPLVLYLAGRTIFRIEDRAHDAKKRYEQALEGAEKLKLSPALRRFIAVELANLPHTGVDRKLWDARAGEWAVAALNDGSYAASDAVIFLRHTLACPGADHLRRAPDALHAAATSSKLPEWVRRTIMGEIETRRGWQARGGGWASEVTPKGWIGFEERLQRARAELVKAWELNPREPYAASAMIEVAMAGATKSGETPRVWFDRAVAAQFDYGPAYSALLNAWRPRWGGDHQQIYAFARACRATDRYDTEVPRVFTEACNVIADDLDDWRELYRNGDFAGIKEEMLDHHRKLLAAPTRAHLRWMDRSFFAINAWLVGAFDVADATLRELPEGLYPPALDKLRKQDRSILGFRSELALMNSAAQDSYLRGEALFQKGSFTEAQPHFAEALPKAPAEAKALVEARLEAIKAKAEFDKGEWITLPIKPGLPGWRVIYGEWEGTAAGELVLHPGGTKGLIVYELSPAPDYEWQAEFQIEAAELADRNGGLAFGYRGFDDHRNLTVANWEDEKEKTFRATLLRGFGLEDAPVTTVPFRETNELNVRVRDDFITFHMNGVEVFRDFKPNRGEGSAPGSLVGLARYNPSREFKTTFRNARMRKLPAE